jgi:phosphoribosyl 1,2-cyclic phosphodiesterase
MGLSVRFWGVRGSIASPGAAMAEVGGNTSCVEVTAGEQRIVLDAGTGLKQLGEALRGPREVTLLLSHLHWDHIQGLPFFSPAWTPGSRLRVLGSRSTSTPEVSLEEALSRQMRAPHFPVGLSAMPARLSFEELGEGASFALGEAQVRAQRVHHPDGVMAYRIEHGGASVVYATDVEPGTDADDALAALAEGADLLIHDAQYTDDEYEGRSGPSRRGWGHASWQAAVRLAERAGVGRLVLFHHDPGRTDAEVAAIERSAARARPGTIAAREGLEVRLPGGLARAA